MTTEKAPKTEKERQAKRRSEMASKGYKNLSLGFVHTKYHEALKKLAAQVNEGGITADLKVKTIIDTSESKKLQKRITELQSELKAVNLNLEKQSQKTIEQSELVGTLKVQLESFKAIFWRFFWKL
tara:strand:+ start:1531 stop:1908 length:378 start_codon:yes stop_codon:yes gene_type:complete